MKLKRDHNFLIIMIKLKIKLLAISKIISPILSLKYELETFVCYYLTKLLALLYFILITAY